MNKIYYINKCIIYTKKTKSNIYINIFTSAKNSKGGISDISYTIKGSAISGSIGGESTNEFLKLFELYNLLLPNNFKCIKNKLVYRTQNYDENEFIEGLNYITTIISNKLSNLYKFKNINLKNRIEDLMIINKYFEGIL